MTQNRISLRFSAEDLTAIEGAIDTLEQRFTGLIGLTPDERRELTKMGDKSEAFCRQAVITLGKHPGVLPRNFDVADYQADLAALRPVIVRLQRVYDRLIDSEMALGSDLMVASLEGYAHLKVAGQADGLDTLRQALGARFDRRRRTADEAAPAQ